MVDPDNKSRKTYQRTRILILIRFLQILILKNNLRTQLNSEKTVIRKNLKIYLNLAKKVMW